MNNNNNWMTVKEAAAYLKVSQMTLFRWMKNGKLKRYKMGNAVRLQLKDLDAIAEPNETHQDSVEKAPSREPSIESLKPRCLMCGAEELIEGRLQSTGVVQFRPAKTKFWSWSEANVPLIARMCNTCGFIHHFADTSKMEKLQPEE
jgi:excisionase family DNA binding protein